MSEQKSRSRYWPWLFGGATALVILCSLCGIGVAAITSFVNSRNNDQSVLGRMLATPAPVLPAPQPLRPTPPPAVAPAPSLPPIAPGSDLETEIYTRVYEFANPSVVAVRVFDEKLISEDTPVQPFFFDTGEGSGFIIDDKGHIVTNRHVVNGAQSIVVRFFDGILAPAEVVGIDRDTDLAVIKVDPEGLNLHPLPLGNIDDLKVGSRIIVIGNPFGNTNTLTTGIISALGRQINLPESQYYLPEVIQTDAAINPGNSGGPMLNEQGEVVGVTFMIQSTSAANAGVGFGIPAYFVERVTRALIANGRYEHPWLGVVGESISPFIARELQLPVTSGVLVATAVADGPAAQAGVRGGDKQARVEGARFTVGGDIITAIDGQPIIMFDDLLAYLSRYTEPGQKVTLTVVRDGETIAIEVTLGVRPAAVGQ